MKKKTVLFELGIFSYFSFIFYLPVFINICFDLFVFKVAELFAENLLLFEAGEKLKFEVDVEQGY